LWKKSLYWPISIMIFLCLYDINRKHWR
jgi:hypothetical protein